MSQSQSIDDSHDWAVLYDAAERDAHNAALVLGGVILGLDRGLTEDAFPLTRSLGDVLDYWRWARESWCRVERPCTLAERFEMLLRGNETHRHYCIDDFIYYEPELCMLCQTPCEGGCEATEIAHAASQELWQREALLAEFRAELAEEGRHA